MRTKAKQLAAALGAVEWGAAWFAQLAFWHISPPIRDRWVWLLLLPVIFLLARWLLTQRLVVPTALAAITLSFLAISAMNFEAAPLRRQDYWVLVCRPLAGMWLVLATMRLAQSDGRLRWPLAAMTALAAAGLMLGLVAVQWDGKSAAFQPVLDLLPRLDARAFLPDAMLSFNPNEMAGALALLCPLMLGLAYRGGGWQRWLWIGLGIGLLGALLLGQSRAALIGVVVSVLLMALVAWRGAVRRWALVAIVTLGLIQAGFVIAVPDRGAPAAVEDRIVSERDVASLQRRWDMLERSWQMLRDHPLTGVGMSMFRTAIRQPAYQIPEFEQMNFTAPHAHNLWAQMAADMGLPGLAWYAALHGWLLWLLARLWRFDRSLAAAVGSALLAYSIYGLADAITLWDRLGFVWWAVIALTASGVYLRNISYNASGDRPQGAKCS